MWVQVTDVFRAAYDMESEQALACHTGTDIPRLEETLSRVGFATRGRCLEVVPGLRLPAILAGI